MSFDTDRIPLQVADDEIAVLHVDDDPAFTALTGEFLGRVDERFSVQTETNPSDGLEYLESSAVDCIVSDYEMPQRDGIEFLESVREEYPTVPFILFTGQGSEAVASEAISAGVSDYLQKQSGREQYELLANRILNLVERTRTRQALEKRESHLSQAQTVANLGSWYKDISADEIYWSEVVYEMFAVDESDRPLDHDQFMEYVHPEDSEYVEAAWSRALEGEEYDIEHRIVTGDGETRWVRERAVIEFDETGSPETALGIVQDITDRKHHERRLSETSARLEALFENSPDMINVHDTEGAIVDTNQRLCEKTGYDESALLGMKVWDLDSQFEPEEAREVWEQMETGDRRRVESEFRRRDGSTFPVEVHLRRLDLEGKDRFVVISRDISEQKERARKLQQQNERLEQFVSTVSHDLRNPLHVAASRVELAKEECDDSGLDDAAEALDRMFVLIDDLLTLSREGQEASDHTTVDLSATAEECWRTVPTEDASLAVETDCSVFADRGRLRQLFENLFQNAIEHGGDDVTVTVGSLDDGFYVADDGPGIRRQNREKLFERGYTTSESGTGLGLTIVGEIADAHGWEINATDSKEGGARFEIRNVTGELISPPSNSETGNDERIR